GVGTKWEGRIHKDEVGSGKDEFISAKDEGGSGKDEFRRTKLKVGSPGSLESGVLFNKKCF
ncbi:MAG: hypothetical protein ACXWEY_16025, partial [Bacteroidia bacterium]